MIEIHLKRLAYHNGHFAILSASIRLTSYTSFMQEEIEHLSARLYISSTPHRFKKEKNSFDRGYMKVNLWMDERCQEAIAKDRQIVNDFDAMVEKLQQWIETLDASDYKEGMKKALKDAGYLG